MSVENKCGQVAQFDLCAAETAYWLSGLPVHHNPTTTRQIEDERRLNKCGQVSQFALCVAYKILGSLVHIFIITLLGTI